MFCPFVHQFCIVTPFGILGSADRGSTDPRYRPNKYVLIDPSQTLSRSKHAVNNKCTKSRLLYRTRAPIVFLLKEHTYVPCHRGQDTSHFVVWSWPKFLVFGHYEGIGPDYGPVCDIPSGVSVYPRVTFVPLIIASAASDGSPGDIMLSMKSKPNFCICRTVFSVPVNRGCRVVKVSNDPCFHSTRNEKMRVVQYFPSFHVQSMAWTCF